ncbi:Dipeptidyl aminopeptidase BIII [Galdieria sulphuraria]|nr:Dipeptidyl aminopeptidase BIII [Galdieria sulphuraria]
MLVMSGVTQMFPELSSERQQLTGLQTLCLFTSFLGENFPFSKIFVNPKQFDNKLEVIYTYRGIRFFQWSEDSRTVLYLQDKDGDENFHYMCIFLFYRSLFILWRD